MNDMITMIEVIDGCVPRRLSGHRKTICRWSNSYTFTHIFFLVFLSFVRSFLLLKSTIFSFHQRCNDTVSLDISNNILSFVIFFSFFEHEILFYHGYARISRMCIINNDFSFKWEIYCKGNTIYLVFWSFRAVEGEASRRKNNERRENWIPCCFFWTIK